MAISRSCKPDSYQPLPIASVKKAATGFGPVKHGSRKQFKFYAFIFSLTIVPFQKVELKKVPAWLWDTGKHLGLARGLGAKHSPGLRAKDTLTGTATQTGWLALALADTPTSKGELLRYIFPPGNERFSNSLAVSLY